MRSDIDNRAGCDEIAYAQCWEDADVLLDALDVRPDDACLSIASAGDNTLALLARRPGRVMVIDRNPAQIACLELRIAAYAELEHAQVLELLGFTASGRRVLLYTRCRKRLSHASRRFWDARSAQIEAGVSSIGRFERYLTLFRTRVLPLAHTCGDVRRLLRGGSRAEREHFYADVWDSWRWRVLFRGFFSRFVMARLGRYPDLFRHVEGDVAERILARTRYALTVLNPADNPYLHWILMGRFGPALPCSLRPENFDSIRAHLDCIERRCCSLEEFVRNTGPRDFDRCNLSDVFEYMAPEQFERTLGRLARALREGARIAYWNMLVARRRPRSLADVLEPLDALAAKLHARDKAFFYSDLVVEQAR